MMANSCPTISGRSNMLSTASSKPLRLGRPVKASDTISRRKLRSVWTWLVRSSSDSMTRSIALSPRGNRVTLTS